MADLVIIDTDILIDAGRGKREAMDCLSEVRMRITPGLPFQDHHA